MHGCLRDEGWDVELSVDGGLHIELPAGQDEIYDADLAACESKFGYDVAPVYSDDEVREIYALEIATANCITQQGYDPGTPPSEQTFVEQVQSGPGGWDAYSSLYPATMDDEEYYSLLERCPRSGY